MSRIHIVLLGGVAMLLLGGCQNTHTSGSIACDSSQAIKLGTPAERKLSYGVLSYEEGNYPVATTALQGVLDTNSSSKQERVKAYKYLGFIQCVSGRELMCRDYFKKALEIDPGFNLDSAEAGHPIWGPVFRSLKSKSAK